MGFQPMSHRQDADATHPPTLDFKRAIAVAIPRGGKMAAKSRPTIAARFLFCRSQLHAIETRAFRQNIANNYQLIAFSCEFVFSQIFFSRANGRIGIFCKIDSHRAHTPCERQLLANLFTERERKYGRVFRSKI